MDKNSRPEMKYASFNMRMLASIIDTVLSLVLLTPIFNLFNKLFSIEGTVAPKYATAQEAVSALSDALPSFLFQNTIIALIVIIFWIRKAGTPGKMLLNMKIVDATTGKKPSAKQSSVRYLGYFVSTIPLCIGFVWIHFDKKKQGWHDKIAGTVVIKESKPTTPQTAH